MVTTYGISLNIFYVGDGQLGKGTSTTTQNISKYCKYCKYYKFSHNQLSMDPIIFNWIGSTES